MIINAGKINIILSTLSRLSSIFEYNTIVELEENFRPFNNWQNNDLQIRRSQIVNRKMRDSKIKRTSSNRLKRQIEIIDTEKEKQ